MNMVAAQSRSTAELVWAVLEEQHGSTEHWHFSSQTRQLSLPVPTDMMGRVNPAGQWLLVELNWRKGEWQIVNLILIPSDDKAVVERHLAWVPAEQGYILSDLWGMLSYFRDKELRAFYYSVLTDDVIMAPFFQAKASHRHHHNHVGGLLEHSHEVAMTAAMLCVQHNLGRRSTCVAFLGGLLHDIGKLHLYYNYQKGVCGQHEAYNFLVLGQPLEVLRVTAPQVFEALTDCLTVKVGKHAEAYLPASLVRMCDRLSVDLSNWRQAFVNLPHYYWYAKSPRDEQIYKRLG
jgi:hypothetical protein